MTLSERVISSLNTAAAVAVSVVFLLLPPVSYGIVAYVDLVGEMERDVRLSGQVINHTIATAPQLWAFQEVRLTELLSREHYRPKDGSLTIFESKGTVVASIGPPPDWPVVSREVPLFDAGTIVGRLEADRSLRRLLWHMGWLSVLGAALGAAAFVTLRVVPLRALRRVNASLKQRDTELTFANTVQTTAMEGSPDGILIVDSNGVIASSNRRFAEMWDIPRALIEAHIDEPVLRAVTSRTKDPDAFLARVNYFYDHPEESGHDRIELKNGRVFERHTSSLYDRERNFLGRIWFFRDMTEREAMEEAVRVSEEKFRNLVESTTDVIWEIDGAGRYTYVSPTVKKLLGFEPEAIVGKAPIDLMSTSQAAHYTALFGPIAAAKRPFSMLESAILRRDGSEIVVETSGVPVLDASGGLRGYRGIDRDVTQRNLAAKALQRRDELLHAVAISATELAAAASIEEALNSILKRIGETIHVDRIVAFERPRAPGGPPIYQWGWQSPDAPGKIDAEFFTTNPREPPDMLAWRAPLSEGKVIMGDTRAVTGNVKTRLEFLGVKTTLVVPMMVDGQYWGHVDFDSCRTERNWEPFEIEILRTLTNLLGNATQRERYVRELRDAMRIVHNTPTILYRLTSGPAMAVSYISQNIKLFGYDPDVFTSSPGMLLTIIHPDEVLKVREALTGALEIDSPTGMVEHRMLTSRGTYRWVENRYTPIRDANGRLVEIEGILVDITERRAAEEKISLLARTDALTGLANRATFIDRLHLAFAAARRGSAPFAVLYLDLDHFKDINDTLGHPIGDQLLKTVAERLKRSTRETDLVARPGGDEFAILQTDLSDNTASGSLAATIRAALAVPIQLEGNELHITASVGIALYTPEIVAPDDMLARADLALYRAKDEGRDQYRFHSEELDERVREQVTIADDLRGALERSEFELYYQPQVELSSGRIVGMEALLRWNHPTRGQLSPVAFIPVAEKTGTMSAIGQWVLDQACGQMSAWRQAGIAPPTIATNVSLAEIKGANEFVQFVTNTLTKWGLAGSDLELDVTESMLAHTTLAHNDVLERLQKIGVKIAIDDFGTTYSSLDYLRTYRVSRLKISKSMVEGATRDSGNAAMVRAITSIARELNVEVVAQGVENELQWSFLSAVSPATNVQGYFYSMPVRARRAGELLRHGVIKLPTDLAKAASG